MYVKFTEKCDKRPVVIQHFRNGGWKTVSQPFECSHEAVNAFCVFMVTAVERQIYGLITPRQMPKVKDFRLQYLDEVPEEFDNEIDDLDMAKDLLNQFRSDHG